MTGTAKQIKYAEDIIDKAITKIEGVITRGEQTIASHKALGAKEETNEKILETWKLCLAGLYEMRESDTPAADIIDFQEEQCDWFEYINLGVCQKCGGSYIG